MPAALSPTVVVASSDQRLLDDLIRYLEEIPEWRLVASSVSASTLVETLAGQSPDVLLVSDSIAIELSGSQAPRLSTITVVVGRDESPAALKAALGIGARGFVRFPEEAHLIRELGEDATQQARVGGSTGALIALWAPKGGSGTSVIAAHLAAALTKLGTRCLLCDLDLDHGDQTSILGASISHRSIVDLVRVKDELQPQTIDSVSHSHPFGFRALFAPGHPGAAGLVKTTDLVRTVTAVRDLAGHVVVDLPSGYSELVLALAEQAHRFLIIVNADVLSLRRTRDALGAINSLGLDESRIDFVLNRYFSGPISVNDVRAVVGKQPLASIRLHRGIERSSDRGELSEAGVRLLEPLASKLLGFGAGTRRGLFRI